MYRRLLMLFVSGLMLLVVSCKDKPPPEGKPRGGRLPRPENVPGGPAKPEPGKGS
jgi:hypothetical protein